MKYPWDKVLIINLKRCPERLNYILGELEKINVNMNNIKVIDAFDGQKLKYIINNGNKLLLKKINNKLQKMGILSSTKYITLERNKFRTGEIGHYISFYTAFKTALHEQYKEILLLEDDTEFINNFDATFCEYYNKLPNDWDIFALSWLKDEKKNEGIVVNDYILTPYHSHYYENKDIYIGTEALLIRESGIRKLIKYWLPMNAQSDIKLDILKNRGILKLYIPLYNLTKQAKFPSDIR